MSSIPSRNSDYDGLSVKLIEALTDNIRVAVATDLEPGARTIIEPNALSHFRSAELQDSFDETPEHLFLGCDNGEVVVRTCPTGAPVETSIRFEHYLLAKDALSQSPPISFDLLFDDGGIVVIRDDDTAIAIGAVQWEYTESGESGGPLEPPSPSI